MKLTSNGVRGKPYHFCIAPQVTAPAAAVRPWKAPSIAATCARPVMRSATFRAFSLASAPLLTKNTLAKGRAENCTSRAAARLRTCHGHRVALEVALLRLDRQRRGEARVRVAQGGHGVAAVEIEHALAAAVGQPHAVRGNHLKRVLREHRREVVGGL